MQCIDALLLLCHVCMYIMLKKNVEKYLWIVENIKHGTFVTYISIYFYNVIA